MNLFTPDFTLLKKSVHIDSVPCYKIPIKDPNYQMLLGKFQATYNLVSILSNFFSISKAQDIICRVGADMFWHFKIILTLLTGSRVVPRCHKVIPRLVCFAKITRLPKCHPLRPIVLSKLYYNFISKIKL